MNDTKSGAVGNCNSETACARYKGVYDYTNNGVAVYRAIDDGEDFVFLDLNSAAEKIENVEKRSIIGKRLTEVFPAVKRFGLFDVLRRVWMTGESEDFPIAFYEDARITGWRENHVYRLPSMEIVAVYSDETERKQSEQKLKEREERLTTILDSILTGVVIIDAQRHVIVDVNRAGAEMIGLPRENIVGHTCHRFICPAEKGKCPITDLGQTVDNSERILIKANGERLPILKTVRSFKLEGRDHLVGTFTDISKRKQAEEALRESEEKFRKISAAANDAFIIMSNDGNIALWNEAAERMFGYTQQQALGKNVHDLLAPERFHGDYQKGFEKFRASGEGPAVGKTLELVGKKDFGEEFPIEMSLSAVQIKGLWNAIAVVRDISERKKADERMRHLALHDSLTGLPNRHLFFDRLKHAISFSKRHNKGFALFYLDLDRFKPINDAFGHEAGDAVLKEIGKRFQGAVRETDTVARLGGDEFAIILPDLTEKQHTKIVLEKILQTFKNPFEFENKQFIVGASIGVAMYPQNGLDEETLLKKADQAMYEAKADCKNDFMFSALRLSESSTRNLEKQVF